jgi:hypothetical protein
VFFSAHCSPSPALTRWPSDLEEELRDELRETIMQLKLDLSEEKAARRKAEAKSVMMECEVTTHCSILHSTDRSWTTDGRIE